MPDPFVFTLPWSGEERLVGTYGYRTDVISAYSRAEQRAQLREIPVETIEIPITCKGRDARLLESQIFGNQGALIGMPLWQYGSRLTADMGIGSQTIQAAVSDLPYIAGEYALVWQDPFTWELFTVNVPGTSSVTTTDAAAALWAAGKSIVYPVRLGRLAALEDLSWPTGDTTSARLAFSMDPASAPPAAGASLPNYAGFSVLELEPNGESATKDSFDRKIYLLETAAGARATDPVDPTPTLAREFAWAARSRNAIAGLRSFIDGQKGRAIPFWAHGWIQDLALASDHAGGSGSLPVGFMGYTTLVFPGGPPRRRLAVRAPGGVWRYRKVTASVDNGNGTETLTLDTPITEALPAAGTIVSYLRLCRLDVDEPQIAWSSATIADAQLPLRELPQEVPA